MDGTQPFGRQKRGTPSMEGGGKGRGEGGRLKRAAGDKGRRGCCLLDVEGLQACHRRSQLVFRLLLCLPQFPVNSLEGLVVCLHAGTKLLHPLRLELGRLWAQATESRGEFRSLGRLRSRGEGWRAGRGDEGSRRADSIEMGGMEAEIRIDNWRKRSRAGVEKRAEGGEAEGRPRGEEERAGASGVARELGS